MWSALCNFVLSLIIFAWNGLLLLAIANSPRLRRPTHLLGANLWLCNCIIAVVMIFQHLSPAVHHSGDHRLFGAPASAVLLNSTVSLLSLLAIGIVHALSRHDYQLSRRQCIRVTSAIWLLAVLLLLVDFGFVRAAHSLILAVPFHLALISVFLALNLIIHPLNLLLVGRVGAGCCRPPQPQDAERIRLLDEAATAAIWLLLNALSFLVVAMMIAWESRSIMDGSEQLVGVELVAFSVHCIANPLIAVIRDRELERSVAQITRFRAKTAATHDELVIALMRDPPPPYEQHVGI